MTEKEELRESIKFVSDHFKMGSLLPQKGWKRFRLAHHISFSRRNVAAAGIVAVVLAASASIYYFTAPSGHSPSEETFEHVSMMNELPGEAKTAKIEFKNTPLKDVVAEIERVYEVKIANVPRENIMVTISYEGTAADVIETLNELFNINLIIATETN